MADFSELDRLSIGELKARRRENDGRLQELDTEFSGMPFPDDVRAEFAGRKAQSDEIDTRVAELELRHRSIEQRIRGGHIERELTEADRRRDSYQSAVATRPEHARRALDVGLRTVDRYRNQDVLSARAADGLDEMLRERDQLGLGARYMEAVGSDDYARAFHKMLVYPQDAHYRFSREEAEAVQRVSRVESERALAEGTPSLGGFAVPFVLDPSILHSSSSPINPIRDLSRVLQVSTNIWKGVSADAPTAAYQAEAAAAVDASPTLVQPTIQVATGRAFVPASFEVWQDWNGIVEELVNLLRQSRDILDATKMLLGTGAGIEPVGVLAVGTTGALTTTQRIQTAVSATYSIADVYAFKAALHNTTFLDASTWVMNATIRDKSYRFVGAGSTTEPLPFPEGLNGPLLGIPNRVLSTLVATTTTASRIAILGDWSGFQVVDRMGVTVEVIPNLFDQATARPSGQRGLLMWWRTGSGVIVANKLRYLEVL